MFDSLNPLYFYPYVEEERNSEELFSVKDTTTYGNIFKNEYKSYKNYVPHIKTPKDAREKLLLDIALYSNAAHDLELYLNIYPTHREYSELFETYAKKARDLEKEFVEKYGPLDASESKYKNGYFTFVTMPNVWLKGE